MPRSGSAPGAPTGDRSGYHGWRSTSPALLLAYVELRVACEDVGHALAGREHDADRWIAATAIHLGVALVTHDGIFAGAPGLLLETALPR